MVTPAIAVIAFLAATLVLYMIYRASIAGWRQRDNGGLSVPLLFGGMILILIAYHTFLG